uniref:thioredoxin n=1 Tax=Timspurckia oligopyrenoides TaxID=708627 RepID=UPI001FCD4B25|nr:thioredoxin [Timspurckia oligopyrenoides]UNJ17444.1 thioredoxin [Timspurckia oligopyrenoides]
MPQAIQITDSSFALNVADNNTTVLVDFWAPWCGPCRMVSSIIDEIAEEYDSKIKVAKINTDNNPKIATEYGIRSIPTLMIFKDGKVIRIFIGAIPKSTLTNVSNLSM